MTLKRFVLPVLALAGLASAACAAQLATPTADPGQPNPASVHCEEQGGQLELRQIESGAVEGICLFSDGSECDEWQYFRDTCKPGDSLVSPATGEAASTGDDRPAVRPGVPTRTPS